MSDSEAWSTEAGASTGMELVELTKTKAIKDVAAQTLNLMLNTGFIECIFSWVIMSSSNLIFICVLGSLKKLS